MSPDGRTTMSTSTTGGQAPGMQQLTVIKVPVCLFCKGNGSLQPKHKTHNPTGT